MFLNQIIAQQNPKMFSSLYTYINSPLAQRFSVRSQDKKKKRGANPSFLWQDKRQRSPLVFGLCPTLLDRPTWPRPAHPEKTKGKICIGRLFKEEARHKAHNLNTEFSMRNWRFKREMQINFSISSTHTTNRIETNYVSWNKDFNRAFISPDGSDRISRVRFFFIIVTNCRKKPCSNDRPISVSRFTILILKSIFPSPWPKPPIIMAAKVLFVFFFVTAASCKNVYSLTISSERCLRSLYFYVRSLNSSNLVHYKTLVVVSYFSGFQLAFSPPLSLSLFFLCVFCSFV